MTDASATWQPKSEMFWRQDPEIERTRKLPGWVEFHRDAGRVVLYFDHMAREGKRGGAFLCDAYTMREHRGNWSVQQLATGRGGTALDSVIDAYRLSGTTFDTAEKWIAQMRGNPSPVTAMVDDFDDEPQPAPQEDDFGDLAADDFGDL